MRVSHSVVQGLGVISARVRRLACGLLSLAACVALAAPARAADTVFWSNFTGNPISFANLDGSGGGGALSTTGATANQAYGVAIDPAAGRIYWANRGDNAHPISYSNLDGSGGGDLNVAGATASQAIGVAIDPTAGRIYWANEGSNAHPISYAKLDGSGGGDLNVAPAAPSTPSGVAIDPAGGRIYWANNGSNGNPISWARLDGSGGGNLNTVGAVTNTATGVAIDPVARKVYWANVVFNKPAIAWANLDGSGAGNLNTGGGFPNSPIGVAIDPAAGRIYWANNAYPMSLGPRISYARLDGSGGSGLGTSGAPTTNSPEFVALLKAPSATGAPAVTGASAVRSSLTCSTGSWASDLVSAFLYQAPRSYAYQWSRNGSEVAGATAASLSALSAGDYTCRVTASNQAGSASKTSAAHKISETQPPPPPAAAPVLSALRLAPWAFRAADRGPSVSAAKAQPTGTTVHFKLNLAASVRFTVQRILDGRSIGKKCVPPSKKNRKKRHCARYQNIRGSFTVTARAGNNSFRFSGRLNGRKLAPGSYRLLATPTANRHTGKTQTARFTILKPAKSKRAPH